MDTTAFDPSLASAIARLDLRRGSLTQRLRELDRQLAAAPSPELKAQRAELAARDARLAALRQAAFQAGRAQDAAALLEALAS